MVKYFKITNIDETHNNFTYIDGLNCMKDDFDERGEHVENGLYFTTIENIPKYYYIGINLREVILPDDNEFKMIKVNCGDKYRANKIILGNKYSLYDLMTYEMFGLNMEYNIHLVNHASEHGNLDFLNKWKLNNLNLKYSSDAIDLASQNGHVKILQWWKDSGYMMKYTVNAMDWACEYGNENVIKWWFNSGLEIKYSINSLLLAFKNKHKNVLKWWKKIMIPEDNILLNDSIHNKNIILHGFTWVKTNFKLIFVNLLIMVALYLYCFFY